MIRFNTQLAEIVADKDLCHNIYQGFILGQSFRHIAKKYDITPYAVKKLANYWQEKENRTTECVR